MIQISYNCLPKSSIKRFSPNCISTSGLSLDSRERRESESYAEGVRLPVVYLSLVVKIIQVMQIYQKFWPLMWQVSLKNDLELRNFT